MPFTAWKHTERNRDRKNIYYDLMKFDDSSTVPNLLNQYIAFIRAYLGTYILFKKYTKNLL